MARKRGEKTTPERLKRQSFNNLPSHIPATLSSPISPMASPSIPHDIEYSSKKMKPSDMSLFSPSEMDCSTGSGTPRETWIVEGMRNELLEGAKGNEVSLLSDDSEWDRV